MKKTHATCEHFRSAEGERTAYCQAHPPVFVVVPGPITEPAKVQCVYPSIHDPEHHGCGEWQAKLPELIPLNSRKGR